MTGPRMRWRWLNWAYAMTHAYFWLPCPLCGRYFGGHEGADASYHPHSAFEGRMVCWRCDKDAREKSVPVLKAQGIVRSGYND